MMRSRLVCAILLLSGIASPCTAASQPVLLATADDLTAMSLEELLDVQIGSASLFSQKASQAPSSVSVLTREDFRDYGWRTLADALNSVRGFHTSSDRTYRYAGVRGFLPPGDYNSRLLLLIDGMRTNDNVFDQAFLGNEFLLDVDLIERIEIVRGPSSPVHGANAFFGVINVVTRSGKDFKRGELAASAASHGVYDTRATLGGNLAEGGDYLLSLSGLRGAGQLHYFPEFDATAQRAADRERAGKFYGKLNLGGLTLSAGVSRRGKNDPTGAFGTVFDDPANRFEDNQSFAEARYAGQLAGDLSLNSRIYYNRYDYKFYGVFADVPRQTPYTSLDKAQARWWGAETRLTLTRFAGHKLGLGVDYQNNARQDQFNGALDNSLQCVANGSADPCLNSRQSGYRLGLALTDDIALGARWRLNLGVRYDRASQAAGHLSPRVGLIYSPRGDTTLKLLYGSAFRAANAFERFYDFPSAPTQQGNPGLKPEVIDTYEAVWEQYLGPATRASAGVYRYRIAGWIVQGDNGGALQYQNRPPVSGRGAEFGLEHRFDGGAALRASYSAQQVADRPAGLLNGAPRRMAKLNFSSPLFGTTAWRTGIEAQYVDRRATPGGWTGGYTLVNATLRWRPRGEKGVEVSASIFNLFDKRWYGVFPDDSLSSGVPREVLAQDGRAGRLKVLWPF
ncbi:MAG: TonB-dependent receptor [Betaproteobacteria bacterium]|nr:TonB-dependent receptor [Betaproteobacteria bacterium]